MLDSTDDPTAEAVRRFEDVKRLAALLRRSWPATRDPTSGPRTPTDEFVKTVELMGLKIGETGRRTMMYKTLPNGDPIYGAYFYISEHEFVWRGPHIEPSPWWPDVWTVKWLKVVDGRTFPLIDF